MVPILRGNHALSKLSLWRYRLTKAEIFVLSIFFVDCKTGNKLDTLAIRVDPQDKENERSYLKLITIVAEKNKVQALRLRNLVRQTDREFTSYAQRNGGFKL